MKLICLQENLKRGLSVVSHAVAGKSTMPVLANVLLATDGARLKLVGTNLEIATTHWIGGQVVEAGEVTVPAKLLSDVVGQLPNEPVSITLDPRIQTITLECGPFTTRIKGIEADEFPAIPSLDGRTPAVTLPPDVLGEALSQIVFAAATDDSRPVLAGVFVRLKDQLLTLQAADGFRAAVRTVVLDTPVAEAAEFIVPAAAMAELQRLIAEEPVSITVSAGEVLFHTPATELVSRLIDGKFPEVDRIIPQQYLARTILDTAATAKAVKLASFFAGQNVLQLSLEPGQGGGAGKLVISAATVEVGENTSEIAALVHGPGGTLALNVKYLTELLAAIKTEQFALETQSPQSAGVFRLVGQDSYTHIIMPMSVK
ncbi:MAG: DNA polymerase III subunit beta [Chloroflexales bacterium]|nr:DNA polymerase III subunit beta [Chloroflexales bacterium]